MVDVEGQKVWYAAWLDSALKFPAARGDRRRAERWARSMSLISEQFFDPPEEGEMAEVE